MSNPIFKMEENKTIDRTVMADQIMTVNGTIQIAAFMGLIVVAAAAFTWSRFTMGYTDMAQALMTGGAIVGFIMAIIIIFARTYFLVPVYAVCEGLFLGGVSAVFESSYPGIVFQAITGTFAAFFSMLILYRTGMIRCTDKFRSTIFIATASIFVVYLVNFIGSFLGYSVPLINSSSPIGIAISAVIVLVAALNLIIDFEFIEQGAQNMYPKNYEWYGAFGLLVTIVWLYVEILKLLAKLRSRD